MKAKNGGSSFDSWSHEEGIYEDVSAGALKRVLARQVAAAMKEKQFSKAEMARRMGTSRAALDRLLDPEYEAVTLSTLRKAAQAVGRQVRLELL
jgi:antitoxin HicB